MKVAMVLSEGRWGGPIKRSMILAPYLLADNIEYIFYIPKGKIDALSRDQLAESFAKCREIEFDSLLRLSIVRSIKNVFGLFKTAKRLRDAFVADSVDLVHVNGPFVWSAVIGAKLAKRKSVVHFNDLAYGFPFNILANLFAYLWADECVSSSYAVNAFYKLRGDVAVIYPPVADSVFHATSDQAAFPEEYKWGGKNICAVGNINALKGYHFLVNAIADMRHNCAVPPFKLWIIGSEHTTQSRYISYLKMVIKSLGLEHIVFLLGSRKTPESYIEHADLFVSSATSEAWSMATAEAVVSNVPIVAFSVGGIPELLQGVSDVALVAPRDVIGLSKAMQSMMSEGNSVQRSDRCRYRVHPESISAAWNVLYKRVHCRV